MNSMRKFGVVLGHTYWTRLKSKAFIISTVVMILFITLFANIDVIIKLFVGEDETKTVAVIDEADVFYAQLETMLKESKEEISLKKYEDDVETGKEQVMNEAVDGLLVITTDQAGLPEATYYENDATESMVQVTLQQLLQQIKVLLATEQAGIDAATLQEIQAPLAFEKIALDETAKTEDEIFAAQGIVYVMLFVLYMAVIIYGQMIATDVATEKSSRVMEILISSAPPVTHMFAKIIGIALLGLTQILVLFFYTVQLLRLKTDDFTKTFIADFGFTSVNATIYLYALVFFILGYLLYATIAAMLGSLVSRVEDVQQLIMPMIFLIMIAFFIAMFGLGAPDAKFITITSYIPFFTPMIMFLRIGMLEIPTWEIALSIAILIATIILFSLIGARIYRGGVLMYGPSRSLKDIRNAFLLTKKEK